MKPFVFLVYVLLGIGRNLPFQEYYVYGLGAADVLFCLLFCTLLISAKASRTLQYELTILRVPIEATAYISILAMISLVFNAPIYGVQEKDVFEILKYSYLAVVMVGTSYCTRAVGEVPALGFVVGVLVSGVIAFLNPMNPDVLGTPQIFNPNVIGNVLSVAIVLCSFVVLGGRPVAGALLAVFAAGMGFFTFSKGTWLMVSLALFACYLAVRSLDKRDSGRALKYGKYLAYLLFVGLVCVVYEYWSVVSLVVQVKLGATEFGASAAEGGSFSARAGLILSAIHMFLMNPMLGIGISNFEHVNHLLEIDLGSAYYDDDNPNSAWFYVLGCMGLPAFILFTWIFFWFLGHLYQIPMANNKIRFLYVVCIALVFLIGGNVQVEMLTAYYYWVALGVVAAKSTTQGQAGSASLW